MKTKIENIFIGFSLADALGVPVEFNTRDSLLKNPVTNMRSYGTYNQAAGTWSDDSSLSFCLAESLCNGYNIADISQRFIDWSYAKTWTPHGRVFDIGNQTRTSIITLEKILKNNDFDSLHNLKYDNDEYSNGNGSLMRILPLLFFIKGMPIKEQFKYVWEVSSLTHPHFRSALSCLIYLKFAEYIHNGLSLEEAYACMKLDINKFCLDEKFSKIELKHFERILKHNINELDVDEIKSSGYVIDTLEASFWSILNTNSYLDTVFEAINLGHDTDTTACVAGGIAGMYYGLDNVPRKWITKLARIEDIKKLALKFENTFK